MEFGYNGKILTVDLTAKQIDVETPSDVFYRTYMGGGCLSLYYLLNKLKPRTDPLSPDNILVFSTSIISGIPMAGITRYTVASRSPLTGCYGESEAGGFWGPELKRAGFDAIIIRGKSKGPVYLYIKDGDAELRDASLFWGLDTGAAQDRIQEDLGDNRIRVALIGPAGEHLVRYACVLNNLKHANGRTGMGAVMGSKNLKAVAVRGTRKVSIADPICIHQINKALVGRMKEHQGSKMLQQLGTPVMLLVLNKMGMLPTRNFTHTQFERADNISGERMSETISVGNHGCYSCPVRCKRKVKVEADYQVSPRYGGPEYETIASLGSSLGVDDLGTIAKGNELCNRYGIDTISVGMTIAFAMECFERGLINLDDTGGIELSFGNAEAVIEIIERIAFRKGFGEYLADGVKKAAERLGGQALSCALHIKGQEIPLHDPRGKFGVGLGYAVSPTGADHLEAPHDTSFQQIGPNLSLLAPLGILEPISALDSGPKKVAFFRHTQLLFNLWNCLGICNFAVTPQGALSLGDVVKVVNCTTGWDTSLYELLRMSERMLNMARMFNLREGFGRQDDAWPERLFEPLPDGPLKGQTFTRDDLERAKDLYYEMMGWDNENGKPTKGKLIELNLEWLAE
jgi:aldehyde:ferredoxin oxidoreductase